MAKDVHFYSAHDAHGCFSNFAPFPIRLGGKVWPTSEHYYQAQKFTDAALQDQVRRAATPGAAARKGRDRRLPLRRDWESVKVDVMRTALHAKFTQHAELRAALLATGDARLVEHAANDSYWGDGGDGSGRNMLGRLLVELRTRLRGEPAPLSAGDAGEAAARG